MHLHNVQFIGLRIVCNMGVNETLRPETEARQKLLIFRPRPRPCETFSRPRRDRDLWFRVRYQDRDIFRDSTSPE